MDEKDIMPVKALAAQAFSKVEITSDGTADGTVIKLNGKEIADLTSFSFRFYDDHVAGFENVFIDFCTEDQDVAAGTVVGRTYWRVVPPNDDKKAAASATRALAFQSSSTIPAEHLPRGDRGQLWAQL